MIKSAATGAGTPSVLMLPTCLVDLFRPVVGFSAVALLERAGCRVQVSEKLTCCGQPAYNSGDRRLAASLARAVIAEAADFEYVVLPSGSCAGMLVRHYPDLFAGDADWHPRAVRLAAKTFELTSFLTRVRGLDGVDARFARRVGYHDSCSGLRELGVRAEPRRLLAGVAGLTLQELPQADACCGFGGTFCVKYPEISNRMVEQKCAAVAASGAEALLGGDLGCLMNIAGKLSRLGSGVEVRHVAEVLAGDSSAAPLCGRTE